MKGKPKSKARPKSKGTSNYLWVIGIVTLVVIVLAASSNLNLSLISSASVAGQTKCVGPKAALNFINEKNCTRIYEDERCLELGKVEIQC